VALESQRLLRASGIHPVGHEPVVVAVRVARAAPGQDIDQAPGGGQRLADVPLPEQVRLVAGDQQDFPGDIGGRRSGERERGVADVDGVDATVGRQRAFEVERIDAEGHGAPVDTHNPGQAQNHPLKTRGSDVLFDLGLVRAVEIRRPQRRVRTQQLVVPMWVARAVHGTTRRVDEAHRMRA
jgi:hypothetical protein